MRYLYCHGFGSDLSASKSRFFAEKFDGIGEQLDVLQLVEGRMFDTSVSAQLRVIEEAARGERVTLIGSSFGGYLSALYAENHPEVARLYLLAPALDFPDRWISNMGESGVNAWKEKGFHRVHYDEKGTYDDIGHTFLEDARNYDAFPDFQQPAHIFHGASDSVVPLQSSEVFVEKHPDVVLTVFEDGHALNDFLEEIWSVIFLGISMGS